MIGNSGLTWTEPSEKMVMRSSGNNGYAPIVINGDDVRHALVSRRRRRGCHGADLYGPSIDKSALCASIDRDKGKPLSAVVLGCDGSIFGD